MGKLFYTDIDLKGNQLLNPVLHKSVEYPELPSEGQIFYSPSTKLTYQCIGFEGNSPVWIPVTGSVADLTHNDNRVVTSVSSSNGVATLGTKGLQELVLGVELPHVGTTALQSLQQVAEAVDRAIDDRVVRNGLWSESGKLLVTNGTKGASETAYSIQGITMHGDNDYEIPTSRAIAQYVAGLAGGLNYKGTVDASLDPSEVTDDKKKDLPQTAVNGDIWVVASNGEYTIDYTTQPVTKEEASHGDLYVASVAGGVVTWGHIPLQFEVRSSDIAKLAPIDGLQTIAIIDGTPIKLGIQSITVNPTATGEANGNVVDGIVFDDNNVATLNKKFVLDDIRITGAPGVVVGISKSSDNHTIDVLQQSLKVDEPENLQYVKGLSQGDNGQISMTAGQFDQIVDNTTGTHETNAPSTKAVKSYVDGVIDGLDVTGLNLVTKDASTGMLYLQTVVRETNGKIELIDDNAPLALQKIASTGQAADVKVPADSGIANSETTVLGGLQGLQSALNNLGDHVVNSIQGIYGEITIGDGLDMNTSDDNKILKAKIKSGDYVTVDAADGIHLDPDKIDSAFDTSNSGNLATVGSIQQAVAGMNVPEAAVADNSDATAIKIKGIYQDEGAIGLQGTGDTAVAWNLDGNYNASTNKIALQSTVSDAILALDGSVETAVYDENYQPSVSGQKKLDFFGVVEENGVISASQNALQSLYFTQSVSDTNPIVTKGDITTLENNSIDAHAIYSPSLSNTNGVCTWEIIMGGVPQAEYGTWDNFTVVEVRDVSNYAVEADVMYDVNNRKIVIRVNGQGYDERYFKAIVLTKHQYTVSNPNQNQE